MNRLEKIFSAADADIRANTAYPVFPEGFRPYVGEGNLFEGVTELCFYIHIPFCRQLCRFCEYTRFLSGDDKAQTLYLDLLEGQIQGFMEQNPEAKALAGFDIGGGTPTALTDGQFARLLGTQLRLERQCRPSSAYEKSIEISFSTINEAKLAMIQEAGFYRISAGLQSISRKLMYDSQRIYTQVEDIIRICEQARTTGIRRFNLDLMYGLPGQDADSLRATLQAISMIAPEQVTLYETRFNSNGLAHAAITRDLQYTQYRLLYEGLVELGYSTAFFGRNTFSRDGSAGVSSYLKERMERCTPYKGFGIAAQSMSLRGLSYGVLKGTGLRHMPPLEQLGESVTYLLPREETAAKYICIAMYNGSFLLSTLERILGESPLHYYQDAFDYIFSHGLMQREGDLVHVTEIGYRFYGAISALFWSPTQQNLLIP